MNVVVVGCGYVGLVTGVGLASLGHDVVGIEVDADRRASIASGVPPFYEAGLEDLLREQLSAGRFRVAAETALVRNADVVLLAVQTPAAADGSIDLRFVEDAARSVSAEMAAGGRRSRVVVIRSTVLPGTASRVGRLLEGRAAVASNPEFLAEGTAVSDFFESDRVVLGCSDESARRVLAELYEPLGAPLVFTSPATAEMAKYASNALLATLISFSNEIAGICETLPGVDAEDVLGIVHRDRRLTPVVDGTAIRPGILSYLKPGGGFGGSCLPKDVSALVAERAGQGFEHPLLRAVLTVNEGQPVRVVEQLQRHLKGLEGRRIALLGAAFKAGTDDVRSSPGLKILDGLLARGARVRVYDPLVRASALSEFEARGTRVVEGLADALSDAEACVVTTGAREFERLPEVLSSQGNGQCVVFDARRVLDPDAFGNYLAVGRGSPQ